ncbi:MAG: hypothetical protein J7M38_15885 [Armatimonadetes bacterium]|nr:hypothetical protein [Armatimonadota bacterium]
MAVQFFVPHEAGREAYTMLMAWARIVGAFALVLGLGSLLRTHTERIRRRRRDWPYSVATIVSFVVMCALGLIWGHESGTGFYWTFENVMVPLDATMFSLLAFFIASAAFRTFRARSIEATLLLVAAVVVMLGRVPSAMNAVLGQSHLSNLLTDRMPDISEWIMNVPTIAGKRGIIFGVALGAIATSLRILLGIERSHLGGGSGGGD